MTTVRQEAWQFYGDYGEADYPPMREGILALKALEGGKWKWNTKKPGNGTSRAFFICNSHITCAAGDGKQMRCMLLDGKFTIQHKGEHGEEASVKKRKNSVLSWCQAADVSLMMTTGAKAGAMHPAMTNVVAQQHEAAGEDPLAYKLPGGGIQGVCVRAHARVWARGHLAHLRPCVMS
jgi:hypothetical protein